MSLIFDSSNDYIRRNSDFPTGTAWSVLIWFKPSDPCCTTTFSHLVSLFGASFNRGLQFQTTALSNSLRITGNSYPDTVIFDPTPTAGNWYAAAITCAGTGATDVHGYLWDATFAEIDDVGARPGDNFNLTQTFVYIGGSVTKAMLGTLGRMKMWSGGTVLTKAELAAELSSPTIVRTTNIYSAADFATQPDSATSLIDYSGQARHWASGATQTYTTDNPPVSGIAVYESVVRWMASAAVDVNVTSATFTPPDNSLLVLCHGTNSGGAGASAFTVSGGGLTWTERAHRDGADSSGKGVATIWTAPVTTGASMTVSIQQDSPSGTFRHSNKLYVVTGHNVASPIGASAEGSATADTNATLTATGMGRLFCSLADWGAGGLIVSTDVEDAAHHAGDVEFFSAFKAADHSAGSQSINIDFPTTAAANWVLLEIMTDVPAIRSGLMLLGVG